jgi:hypothetical protein
MTYSFIFFLGHFLSWVNGLNLFFFIPQSTIVNAPIQASKTHPSAIDSALWSLFSLWQLKKEEIEAFC